MSIQPWWLAVVVGKLTDDFSDGMIIAEGLDPAIPPGPEDLQYALLMRVAAESTADAHRLTQDAACEFGYVTSEIIADQPGMVIRSERRLLASLEPREVLVQTTFVGFKSANPEAQAVAIGIIRQAIRKAWWQFWR